MNDDAVLPAFIVGLLFGFGIGMISGDNLRQGSLERKCEQEKGFWADDENGVWFKCEKKEWSRE